nr:ribonuclease H-like domain-containing protein [Tanacetum cinerariifolium]
MSYLTDYEEINGCIMGEPLSPNRVFDFPVDEPDSHPAYDFFAPGPLPGYADQKLARRNELKARGTLLMAMPDKHQLKFNSHKDAKILMEVIEKRFGGNTETKKVQKTILKQQFENFTGSSYENLDQIHDRLQNLVSQLEIHRVSLSQEDVNLKFLRSLPYEWKTHTLIWRNKANIEEHSLDDLFNISAATSVSAVCAQLPVSSHPNIDSLSNAVIFSFFANQSTSPQLDNEDLKQIDVVDLEEMDLRWQMAMLTMRARREYRSPKDTRRTDAAEPQRRHVPIETSTSNALVSQCDGIRSYDWSYQAEEEPANFALMAITSSSSSSDNEVQSCSKACSKAYDQLHSQYDKLTVEFQKSQINVLSYQAENDSESLSPSCPSDRLQPSGGYNVVPPLITGNFMPPKPNLVFHTASIAVETNHSAFTVQLSPAKPAQDLSHTTRPMAPIIEDWVSDSEDESEPNDPQSVPGFVQTSEHVKPSGHSVQPVEAPILAATSKPTSPKTNCSSKRKNRKTCFVCRSVNHLIKDCNFHAKPKTQPTQRNYAHRGYTKSHASFTKNHPQKHIVPAAVLIKSKPVSVTAVRPVSAAVPKIMVTRPRHAHSLNTKSNSTIRRHKTRSQSSKTSITSLKVTAAKAQMVSAAKGKKGKWVWRPKCPILDYDSSASMILKRFDYNDILGRSNGCSRHMIGNMSYLSDFQELNDFKLPDESQVLLRVPRENNMYNVNLKEIVPSGDLTCLFAKATTNESNLWHRRIGHVNFKTINKLVKGNPVRGLPTKVFENNNNCVACKKGKQHKASWKTKPGIKKEFSVPKTPQQNGIAERKNRTLIKAARTMLADSLLPIPFWAEAVNIACYVQNRVLVTKPHNKTLYELLHGRTPSICFMRPFGCSVTILNTLDPLGKFKGKVDEGFLVGYSVNSKAFIVFNSRTHIVQETLHVNFLENKPNIAEKAEEEANQQYMLFPVWSTGSLNPQNKEEDASFDCKEHDAEKPESAVNISPSSSALSGEQDDMTKKKDKGKSHVEYFTGNRDLNADFEDYSEDSSNNVSATGPIVPTARDASQPPDMIEREDIAYSDNENVGAEADFNNLETSITVSPIPTTRTHKDHLVFPNNW